MKPDTFNVPAYKFALVRIGNGRIPKNMNSKDRLKTLEKELDSFEGTFVLNGLQLLPFEDVDGLTYEEVFDILNTDYNEIIFICYYGGISAVPNSRKRIFSLFISGDDDNKTKPFDKIIEKIFEEKYINGSVLERQAIRCFFERYQDKTHQDTIARVKKLIK